MTEHERSTPDPSPQSPPERPLTVHAAEAEAVRTTVDAYVRQSKFRDELGALRGIILATGLEETLKWRTPCYMWERRNVVLVGAFRDHIILSFIKGALIPDTAEVLSPQGENSRSVRVMRFRTLEDVERHRQTIQAYIEIAVQLEREGRRVPKALGPLPLPVELRDAFAKNAALETAFKALSRGRQRGYCLYFNGAKRTETRRARVDKSIARILDGKGLRDCTCGLSRRMPACDGSHKHR